MTEVQRLNLALAFMLLLVSASSPVTAQPTPARDGTGTQILHRGDRFTITGGTYSGDRTNLFHSFERFGLDANQAANFRSIPGVENILGRIVGGDVSVINGLIEVTGGDSNLFLMNPAGLIFGPNARLNVPGDFTATTADGIGMDSAWFNAFQTNPYADLVGSPDGYRFSSLVPGSVINAGALAVSDGAALSLIGGTVVNTGSLRAPGGRISAIAVPGESYIQLRQEGMLLALDIQPLAIVPGDAPNALPFTPLSLPELLTGDRLPNGMMAQMRVATEAQITPDGTIQLVNGEPSLSSEPGTTIMAGTIDTASDQATLHPEINLLGSQVALLSADVDASGDPGGAIRIGGGYQGQDAIPNAQWTYVDADTTLTANGLSTIRDEGKRSDGGRTIVWSDRSTEFYGSIMAQGQGINGQGGFAEVSGKESLVYAGTVDLSAPNGQNGTLLLDPENITIVDGSGGDNDEVVNDGVVEIDENIDDSLMISETALETASETARIQLQATNDITLEDLSDDRLDLQNGITISADADNDGVGAFRMDASDTIAVNTISQQIELSGTTLTLGDIAIAPGGELRLIGDEIDLIGGLSSLSVLVLEEDAQPDADVSSQVVILPKSDGRAIALGARANAPQSENDTLDLSRPELSSIASDLSAAESEENIAGFDSVTIGGDRVSDITIVDEPTTLRFKYDVSLQADRITINERDIAARGLALHTDHLTISNGSSIGIEHLALINQSEEQIIRIGTRDSGKDNSAETLDIARDEWRRFSFEPFSSLDSDVDSTLSSDPDEFRLDIGISTIPNLPIAMETQRIVIDTPIPRASQRLDQLQLAANEINLNSPDIITANHVILLPDQGTDRTIIGGGRDTNDSTLDLIEQDLEAIVSRPNRQLSIGPGFHPDAEASSDLHRVIITESEDPLVFDGTLNLNAGPNLIIIQDRPMAVNTLSLTADEMRLMGTPQSIELNHLIISTYSPDQDMTISTADILRSDQINTVLELTEEEMGHFQFPDRMSDEGSSLELSTQDGTSRLLIQTPLPDVQRLSLRANEIDLQPLDSLSSTDDINPVVGPDLNTPDGDGNDINPFPNGDSDGDGNNLPGADPVDNSVLIRAEHIDLLPAPGSSMSTQLGVTSASESDDSLDLTRSELRTVEWVGENPTLVVGAGANVSGTTAVDTEDVGGDVTVPTVGQLSSPLDFADRGIHVVLDAGTETITINRAVQANTLTLRGNEVNLEGADGSIRANMITIQPGTSDQRLRLGAASRDEMDNALDLTPAELATLDARSGDLILQTPQFTLDDDSDRVGLAIASGETPLRVNTSLRLDLPSGAVSIDRPLAIDGNLTLNLPSSDRSDDSPVNSLSLQQNISTTGHLDIQGTGQITIGRSLALEASQLTVEPDITGESLLPNSTFQATATAGDLTLANVTVRGDIILTSENGSILTGKLNSANSAELDGGDITIIASDAGRIVTDDLTSSGMNGGTITIQAADSILLGNINARGQAGNGGDVSLESSGNIELQRISTRGQAGNGGNVSLEASGDIELQRINTRGLAGNGGNVTLEASGDIELRSPIDPATSGGTIGIDTRGNGDSSGDNGIGGAVNVTAGRFFRILNTSDSRSPVSIWTAGTAGDGSITIRHGGGSERAFIIGLDQTADNTNGNGTIGALRAGDTLVPIQEILGDFTSDTIRIVAGFCDCDLGQIPIPPVTIPPVVNPIDILRENNAERIEAEFSAEFADYLNLPQRSPLGFAETQDLLQHIEQQTENRSAIVYAVFVPSVVGTEDSTVLGGNLAQESDHLELLLITPDGDIQRWSVLDATRSDVLNIARSFRRLVTQRRQSHYLPYAQTLYQWLIEPLATELKSQDIDTLLFSMDSGLRSLPLAALHNGEQFIVEEYSIGLVPSLSLTDTRYVNLQDARVLAMGVSKFDQFPDLPSVPLELSVVTDNIWDGSAFLNDEFTLETLKRQKETGSYQIVHLATHAGFLSGTPENSFIQLWDEPLPLNQFRELGWRQEPGINLAVLSACQTALGNEDAELGFAGLAVQSGAQSVLASLWSVSDLGTLMLMTEFYQSLQTASIRADAIRNAQLSMLRGNTRLENGQLVWTGGQLDLPPELEIPDSLNFTHPYYWSGFTLVGSPW